MPIPKVKKERYAEVTLLIKTDIPINHLKRLYLYKHLVINNVYHNIITVKAKLKGD